MDYHGLNRKELQALCKKHGIPANLKNFDMATRLSSLLKEENATKKGKSCLKNLDDDKLLEGKAPKRVKFSPQNETFVFEKTDPRKLRLLARNTRASRKSQFKDNPVLVAGIVNDDDDVGHLEKPVKRTSKRKSVVSNQIADSENGDLDKPVQRVSRRKSVVPDPTVVSYSENVDKPVGRVSRRKSVATDPIAVSETENVDKSVQRVSRRKYPIAVSETENVDKPVQRASRRKSVVPDSTVVSDSENVDKPIRRVSRRKSVVPDPTAMSDTENINKPVRRVSRQKSVVPDPIAVLDTENVDKPFQRVSRRKSVVPNPIEDTENVVVDKPRASRRKSVVPNPIEDSENVVVDKPVQRASRRKSVVVSKPITVADTKVVDEVEKPAGRNLRSKDSTVEGDQVGKPTGRNSRRKDSTVEVDEVVSSEVVVDNVEKPIKKLSRRKSVVAKTIGAVKVDKPAQRNLKRKGVLTKQDEILDTEMVTGLEEPAKRKPKSVVVQSSVDKVEEPAHYGKKDHMEDVLMSPSAVNKAKRSRKGQILVGRGAVDEVDRPPDQSVGLVGENSMRVEMVTVIPENGDNSIQADDGEVNLPLSHVENAETQGDTMASEGEKIEEVLDQAIDEKNAEGKPPDMVEDIKKPKQDDMNAENFMEAAGFLTNSSENHLTVQSEDCLEEMKGIDKTPKIEVEASKTPISHGSLNIRNSDEHVAENSMQSNKAEESHETPSHQKIAADKIPSLLKINIDGALCESVEERTSAAGEPTCSSALKSNILGNSEVHNAEEKQPSSLIEMMDNGIHGSTKGLESYNQIKNEELGGQEKGCEASPCLSNSLNIEDTAEDGKNDCAAVSFNTSEVQSAKQEGTDGSIDFISEVVGPQAVTKVDVQQPPIVDGMAFSTNIPHATINKILEEAKNIDTFTPLANQRENFSAYLFQSLNKDDGEGKTEASSANTFLLNLESKIADTMRLLSVPMREVEECSQETSSGDIACVASSNIKVKNLTENSPIIPEPLNEMDMKLEVEGDDFINCAEGKEMKYEKAVKAAKHNSCGLFNGGETPVVYQERNWAQVAGKINISPGPVPVIDEDMKSISYCDRSNPVNFKESEVSDASHPGSVVSCLDVEKHCEVSQKNDAADTSVTESDQEFHLKDDTSSDRSTILQQEILQPLENHCGTSVAPSCSMVEESQKGTPVKEHSKGTPTGGLACSANDANLEYAAEDRECIIVMKPEEAHFSNEFKSECLVSEEGISYHAQNKDQPCSTEEFTIFDNLIAQAYSVAKEMENFSQETGLVNDAEGASSLEKSPESTNYNELDEVLGTEFDWQTKSARLIKKEFKNDIPEQLGSSEGAVFMKDSSKATSVSDFDGTLENGLASQCSYLITVPEGSESNDGDQIAKVCLMEDIDSRHIAKNGNTYNSCVGQLEMIDRNDSSKDSETLLHDNLASGLDDKTGSIVVACPPVDNSRGYFANVHATMSEIASDSLQEKKCHKTLQNASICDVEGLCSSQSMLLENDKDIKGDMVETNVEKSDTLSSISPVHNEIVPQATVSKSHDGSESMSREKETEFSSALVMGLQDLTSSPFSVANSKKDDTEGNLDNVSPTILMYEMDPLSFVKNDLVDREMEEAVDYVSEEQIDNHMNAGNVKGQESVCEGNIGCDMEAIEEDNCVEANDDFAPSTESSDRLPCDASGVSDVAINIVHEKSIKLNVETEFDIYEGKRMVGQDVINEELVDGNIETIEKDSCVVGNGHPELEEGSDNVETSPCTIYKMDSITENLIPRERNSPVYKEETDELDSAKTPDLRDAQDDKGCSVISGEKQACIQPIFSAPSSESLIPNHNTVKNEEFVDVSGVRDMVQEASADNPFTLLEQETDDGNPEPQFEDGRFNVIHVGRGPNCPAICENKVNDSSEEIAYSHPTEENDKLAEADINRPLEMQIGSDFNHYDASDNRAETDFSSPCVPEIFTDQHQQQNHASLMPSNQQVNPSESAYQSDTIATTLLDNGNMKPDVESFIYTDSEMDLFWGEMVKDEVKTSQTETSDAAFSVNEHEIANPENDSQRQERVGESDGEIGNNQKTIIVEESENVCPLDANNSEKVAEKDKVLMSSMVRRKNSRSILIHGTPKKPVPIVHDMKENPPTQKRVQMVNATAVKSNFRRKALDDIAK